MADVRSREPGEFYLIWTKTGRNPRVSHTSIDAARAEARHLAERYPNKRWFILRAVERLWVNDGEARAQSSSDGTLT